MTEIKLAITYRKVKELRANPRNCKIHPAEQIVELRGSIRTYGFNDPVAFGEGDELIEGHGRLEAAELEGMDEVPAISLVHLSERQRRGYIIAHNKLAERSRWDFDKLADEVSALLLLEIPAESLGFNEQELDAMLKNNRDLLPQTNNFEQPPVQKFNSEKSTVPGGAEEKAIPRLGFVVTTPGDVWLCGGHRVMCGDSTNEKDVATLLDGDQPDAIITDPPYSSGGFQESGRAAGSIGTKRVNAEGKERTPTIVNDKLSTRGYIALLKSAFFLIPAKHLYCFTDWRMWVNLFDVSESSGFNVRSMIVWNKLTPGMGRGWRTQHELCLYGSKETPDFDNKKAGSNVLTIPRTKNSLHPTQKPVDLIREILRVTHFAKLIADPFGGSGSTLIACEMEKRKCRTMEKSEDFADTIVLRWQLFTGKKAVHQATGKTFDQVMKERHG